MIRLVPFCQCQGFSCRCTAVTVLLQPSMSNKEVPKRARHIVGRIAGAKAGPGYMECLRWAGCGPKSRPPCRLFRLRAPQGGLTGQGPRQRQGDRCFENKRRKNQLRKPCRNHEFGTRTPLGGFASWTSRSLYWPARFSGHAGPDISVPRLGYRLNAIPSGT